MNFFDGLIQISKIPKYIRNFHRVKYSMKSDFRIFILIYSINIPYNRPVFYKKQSDFFKNYGQFFSQKNM